QLEAQESERKMRKRAAWVPLEVVAAALDLGVALQRLGREVNDEEFARLTDGLIERYKEVKRHAPEVAHI
ncbi:MAG: hypothetical protein ACUVRX_12490, partial [Actinomycetota bacterium]